jgi:hypothetical protein
MDTITIFGILAVTAMLLCYALEDRGPTWILCFAGACLASSAYAFLQGAWPFGLVEAIWTGVAIRRWRAASRTAPARRDAIPIACNMAAFSPPERERYRLLRERVMAAVTGSVETSAGFTLTVSDSLRAADIAEWLSLERRCCPFLDLTLHLDHTSPARIDLHGRSGTKEFLRGEFPQLA